MATAGLLVPINDMFTVDVTTLPVITAHDVAQMRYSYGETDLLVAMWQWTPTSNQPLIFDTWLTFDQFPKPGLTIQTGLIPLAEEANGLEYLDYQLQGSLESQTWKANVGVPLRVAAYGAQNSDLSDGTPNTLISRPFELVLRVNDYGSTTLWDAPVDPGSGTDPGDDPGGDPGTDPGTDPVSSARVNTALPGRRAFAT